jgi:hypothetical protein
LCWYFTLHYFAVNFGMQEPFFSIDSVPQLSKFGFTQFQIVFLYIARGFRKDHREWYGQSLPEQKTAFTHSLDNTVKCQSNHPPKSVRVSSGYRHKRFVESQTNTPPDQLSEAQIFKIPAQH